MKTPQDVLRLCDSALLEQPVKASDAICAEVTKAIEKHIESLDKNAAKKRTEPSKNTVSPKKEVKKINSKVLGRIKDKYGVDSAGDGLITSKPKRKKTL